MIFGDEGLVQSFTRRNGCEDIRNNRSSHGSKRRPLDFDLLFEYIRDTLCRILKKGKRIGSCGRKATDLTEGKGGRAARI